MKLNNNLNKTLIICLIISVYSCKIPNYNIRNESKNLNSNYRGNLDTNNSARTHWKSYFADSTLIALIDTALKNNQELNIMLQEIEINKNDIKAKKGEYLPFVNIGVGAGFEKEGKYTRKGAVDDQLKIKGNENFPEPLTDFMLGAYASWEVDIVKKLRNARKSAIIKYLASQENRQFMITNLVAEIADAYYELLALDNLLIIINQNIDIQSNALKIIKQQKDVGKVTLLAVNRFEAQLLNTQNLQYEYKQKIIEIENRINFLTARTPLPINRPNTNFSNIDLKDIQTGIPAQLLVNRPDIRQAELNLMASKIDVKVAKAYFMPSLNIRAGIGFQSFNPIFLLNPESFLYNLAGDLMAPLINKNAIKANYASANAKQLQAVFMYEQTILNAYLDVLNQMSKIDNYTKSFETKSKEVNILIESIHISQSLFNSARADYGEVLLTQREALEAKLQLIEIKLKLMNGKINIYRALGGGWN
ncbi:MAG: TolC family protein [Alphaproteobacteria bacterium]|nr:TolC family protein [Alphaproteobacteria bacterium]